MKQKVPPFIIIGVLLLFLSVALGAFGAHGLTGKISEKALETFKTGVFYHQLHAVCLITYSLVGAIFSKEKILKLPLLFLFLGIILFSGNCYIYALSSQKIWAMIVPFGGMLFLLGHFMCFVELIKKN